MKLTTVLFDLDGTLLPMDQDLFTKTYLKSLASKLAPLGYEPKKLIDGIWTGTKAMIRNNGSKRNDEVFWAAFSDIFGDRVFNDQPYFDEFYRTDFQNVRSVCGFNPEAAETVRRIRDKGLRVALATNPLFPAIATESRIRWAGLTPEDFELYTTYENIEYCKPNPAYYSEIVKRLDVDPKECLMVGNDTRDDMAAKKTGMDIFLLPDSLINEENVDISSVPHGNYSDLLQYINRKLS